MRNLFCMALIISILAILTPSSWSQNFSESLSIPGADLNQTLADALRCIKMTPQDLRFRNDYVDLDSFRLELIDQLMQQPLDLSSFNSQLRSDWSRATPKVRRRFLPFVWSEYLKRRNELPPIKENKFVCPMLDPKIKKIITEFSNSIKRLPLPLASCLAYLHSGLRLSRSETREAFAQLTEKERVYLKDNFPLLLLEDVNDEFKSPEEIEQQADHEEKLAKEMTPYLYKIDLRRIILAAYPVVFAIDAGAPLVGEYLRSAPQIKPLVKSKEEKKNDLIFRGRTSEGEIIIGGLGSSLYTGSPAVIIDLGGDDEYRISSNREDDLIATVIIDMEGNDIYYSENDYVYGSGFFGTGILVDLSGDDTYLTKNFSLGSGLFGVGILIDEEGDDKYFGDTFTMGAGSFGMGFLVDMKGSDQYCGALFAQGLGFVSGMGALIDSSGNDNYFAGGRYKDILRYKDHYISLSQGFAYGLRPMMSGGIGILFDFSGNDVYTSDIFGQGSSYWWSLGTLMDLEGNDKYLSFQYAQGAGTHLTLGILEDGRGNDVYISHGVSQGCGHDLALGLLHDRSGNDTYLTYDLSQGAGSANGFGILIDEGGDDGYYVGKNANTQGYGNPRRDYGSVGILLDLAGKDRYNGNGKDSTWWITPSKWGVGIDK